MGLNGNKPIGGGCRAGMHKSLKVDPVPGQTPSEKLQPR